MKNYWYYGWNVVALTLLFQALCVGVLFHGFSILVVPLAESFDVPNSRIFTILLAIQLVLGVLMPIAGKSIDKIEARTLLCFGMICLIAALFLSSLTKTFLQLLVVCVVFMSLATIYAGAIMSQKLVTSWFEENRGVAMGISSLGSSVGGVIFPLLLTYLIEANDWRYALRVMGIVAVACLPVCWLVLSKKPANQVDAQADDGADDSNDDGNGHSSEDKAQTAASNEAEWTTMQVLRSRDFWIITACLAPLVHVFPAFQLNLVLFTIDVGHSTTLGASLVSAMAFSTVFGKMSFGWMCDNLSYTLVCRTSVLLLAFSLLMFIYFASSVPMLFLAVFIYGFAAGSLMPMMGMLVGHSFGTQSFGQIMGLISPILALATAVGPVVFSTLQEMSGSYNTALYYLLLVIVPSFIVAQFLSQKSTAPEQT